MPKLADDHPMRAGRPDNPELLDALRQLIGRPDVYAVQNGKAFHPIRQPLTDEILKEHLRGRITVGTYTNFGDRARTLVWDIDKGEKGKVVTRNQLHDAYADARRIKETLVSHGFPTDSIGVVFTGGRGYHVWLVFRAPVEAARLQRLGDSIRRKTGIDCEVFPKQGDASKTANGLGNLIRIPCGKHQATGQWSGVLEPWAPVDSRLFDQAAAQTIDTSGAERESESRKAEFEEMVAEYHSMREGDGRNNLLTRILGHLALHPDRRVYEATARVLNEGALEPLDEPEFSRTIDSIWGAEHSNNGDDFQHSSEYREAVRRQRIRLRAEREARELEEALLGGSDVDWAPTDLGPVLRGEAPEVVPAYLRRNDGVFLLYPGKVHSVYGEPESCKGWLALTASAERLRAGEHIVYVDFEDDENTAVERLLLLGVDGSVIEGRFHYVRPEGPLAGKAKERFEAILACAPTLVVFDGVTEAMNLHGFSIKDNDEIADFNNRLLAPVARHGAAVLTLDHVTKDKGGRGRFAIGGQHKLAGVHAGIAAEVRRPFGIGLHGIVRLRVFKDRPGRLRPLCDDSKREQLAEVHLHSSSITERVQVEVHKWVAEEADRNATNPKLERARSEVSRLVQSQAMSKNALRARVNVQNRIVDAAIELLENDGFVKVEKTSRGHFVTGIRAYSPEEEKENPQGELGGDDGGF